MTREAVAAGRAAAVWQRGDGRSGAGGTQGTQKSHKAGGASQGKDAQLGRPGLGIVPCGDRNSQLSPHLLPLAVATAVPRCTQ